MRPLRETNDTTSVRCQAQRAKDGLLLLAPQIDWHKYSAQSDD